MDPVDPDSDPQHCLKVLTATAIYCKKVRNDGNLPGGWGGGGLEKAWNENEAGGKR